jgi:hypothetical protein
MPANNEVGIKFADGTFQYTAATGSSINVQEEGSTVVTGANVLNFVGATVNVTSVGGVATINVTNVDSNNRTLISGISIRDEGNTILTSANTINFIGTGVMANNANGVANVTINRTTAAGDKFQVQISDGNGNFWEPNAFEPSRFNYYYDFTYDSEIGPTGLVEIGYWNGIGGSGRPSEPNTDLLVQGGIVVGTVQNPNTALNGATNRTGYAEFGRIRYLDDVGYDGAYPLVYGFPGELPTDELMENWMVMVNEKGHENIISTAIVLGQSSANANTVIFGVSVNDRNPADGSYISDPHSNNWTQVLNLTGRDLFLPRLTSIPANNVLAYNTETGRVTYTVPSIIVQDEGSTVVARANTLNFVGGGITATSVGGVATITVGSVDANNLSFISGLTIRDEGNLVQSSANTLNFVGTGIVANTINGVATITVTSVDSSNRPLISGIAVQEEGSNVVTSATVLNFVGSTVTASNVGGVATINVTGVDSNNRPLISGITVKDEGSTIVATATEINFVGAGVTTTNVGGVATVNISSSSTSSIEVQDEGSAVISNPTAFNFVGAGVTATSVGTVATITIGGASNNGFPYIDLGFVNDNDFSMAMFDAGGLEA